MTEAIATAPAQQNQSLIVRMATQYGLEPNKFYTTLEKTILPAGKQATQEQVAAFLVVANHYGLNPFVKEIYAFPSQNGGITPIVSIDGWLSLINRQPQLDGIEFKDHLDDTGNLTAVTAKIYRKDRQYPTEVTEYMKECRRNTSTWSQWPARMLRHKAAIQAARYAFGFAGIYDPDEAERIAESPGNGDSPIAAKTQDRIAELKDKLAPPLTVTDDEPPVINAEPVFDEPANEQPEAESGLGEPAETQETSAAPSKEESQAADLLIMARDLHQSLKAKPRRQADEWLGQRMLDQLSVTELEEYLDIHSPLAD